MEKDGANYKKKTLEEYCSIVNKKMLYRLLVKTEHKSTNK